MLKTHKYKLLRFLIILIWFIGMVFINVYYIELEFNIFLKVALDTAITWPCLYFIFKLKYKL
jgi:hypothetical protein